MADGFSGVVYGAVLNDHPSLARLGGALSAAPYLAPPAAPVLYIKPANTFAPSGARVPLPHGVDAIEIGATVGMELGQPAYRLGEAAAMAAVGALRLVLDLTSPHTSVYRPPIRDNCFDRSCIIGPPAALRDITQMTLRIFINGAPVASRSLADLIRAPAQLLADVCDFMTLRAGDMLLVGVTLDRPLAGAGDHVALAVDGFEPIEVLLTEALS